MLLFMNSLPSVSHAVEDTQLTCKPTVGVDVLDDCCDLEVYKYIEHTYICVWKSMKSFRTFHRIVLNSQSEWSWPTHHRWRRRVPRTAAGARRANASVSGMTCFTLIGLRCQQLQERGKQNNNINSTMLLPRRGCLVHFRLPHRSGLSPPARRSPANAAQSDKRSVVSTAATDRPPLCILSSSIPFFHFHAAHTGCIVWSLYEKDFLLIFIYI